jgi:pyocin large subunit-like protein
MPFANPLERATHFVRHGAEFGCATESEYEMLAEQFLFGPMDTYTRQCVRPKGNDRLRFRPSERHFGVASVRPEFIRTFYKVRLLKIQRHGGSEAFFRFECARIDL